MKTAFCIGYLFLTVMGLEGQSLPTWCNPVDINYQYNFEQQNEKISYRSGADPVIINHRGEFYLFVTISGGWWHSSDLLNWKYVKPDKWPMEDMCAPAAVSAKDTLFLLQSTFDLRPIFYTTTPWNGHLEFYNRLLPKLPGATGPWDPAFFYDEETDKWYLYWGSSNVFPLYGIELDPANRLSYKGIAKPLLHLQPSDHGWERFGQDHRQTIRPFTEGAWMTKHNNRYYLQYGAPGTEYNVYANGTYVGNHPLGPFEYAPYNPVSYKPGGFLTGAGHGNTFQDNWGNYFNTGTPWIAVNWNFERRIAMFPAGFDADGQMFSYTRFGDFPHYLPQQKWQRPEDLFTGWMLLSYRKPCLASSQLDTFSCQRITDENPRTFWVAAENKAGEFIQTDLEDTCLIRAIQVNFTDYRSSIFKSDSTVYTQFLIAVSTDGMNWKTVADLTHEKRDRPNAYIPLPDPVRARYVRYIHNYAASNHLAISDLRVFGIGPGNPPEIPGNLTAIRDKDRRNAFLEWSPVAGSTGYNICWGIAPDKLYQTYQLFSDTGSRLEIRALNLPQTYYFAIEAFNENGVSPLSNPIKCE